MAYPGADIYEIADNGLQLTELEQTPHYLLMKRFCLDHEGMLRQLGFDTTVEALSTAPAKPGSAHTGRQGHSDRHRRMKHPGSEMRSRDSCKHRAAAPPPQGITLRLWLL